MLRLNLGRVEQALEQAFAETAEGLEQHLVSMFDDPVWQWPGETKRKSGQTVGSPRNIVDSGDLKGSQTLDTGTPLTLKLEWSAPYADAVFLGSARGPARNLPLLGLREFDFPAKFAARARGLL